MISTLTFTNTARLVDAVTPRSPRGSAAPRSGLRPMRVRAAPRALDLMHHLVMATLRQIHGVRT